MNYFRVRLKGRFTLCRVFERLSFDSRWPEAQRKLALLLGGKILFCNGRGGGALAPLFSILFSKQKFDFVSKLKYGFEVEKRKFSVVACRFGCVQFKSIFCSCVFTKFILPTAVKWMIWVNSLNMCANRKRVFFKYLV